MKKIVFVVMAISLLGATSVIAKLVPINTPCGKTVYVDSNDYQSSSDMVKDAVNISNSVCP